MAPRYPYQSCFSPTTPCFGSSETDDLQYDNKSAFTLSINHRDTFTGITDRDRALTTRRFGELSGEVLKNGLSNEEAQIALGRSFEPRAHPSLQRISGWPVKSTRSYRTRSEYCSHGRIGALYDRC